MAAWDRNVIRAFTPALGCWLVSAVALMALEWAQPQPAWRELASVLRWLVLGALLACVGSGGWTAGQLWARRRQLDTARDEQLDGLIQSNS